MSRPRRSRARGGMPLHLARYDWREWREPAALDDPFPEYSTWYLGLSDWHYAREQWLHGVLVPPKVQIPQTRTEGQRLYVSDPVNTLQGVAPRG